MNGEFVYLVCPRYQPYNDRAQVEHDKNRVQPCHCTGWTIMTTDKRVIVLGTHNRKKGRELSGLFAPWGFEIRTLADFTDPLIVVEDGQTFADNAKLKACRQAVHLGAWVLGEDSGLAVDAQDRRPGVYSARFSGAHATDASNNARLLEEMSGVRRDQRWAHYVCHTTLSDPSGEVRAETEACCHGRIADAPRGTAGFGYDPLFEIVEYHRTFGELGDAVKAVLSHRGRAVRHLLPHFRQLVRSGAWTCAMSAHPRDCSLKH
jgi:XTP/dITP diphosphohydrolase